MTHDQNFGRIVDFGSRGRQDVAAFLTTFLIGCEGRALRPSGSRMAEPDRFDLPVIEFFQPIPKSADFNFLFEFPVP